MSHQSVQSLFKITFHVVVMSLLGTLQSLKVWEQASCTFELKGGVVQVVPVDGDVWEGKATVTVEHLTGEATPVEKQVGDAIPGGARNLDGIMIVKVPNDLYSHRCVSIFRSKISFGYFMGDYFCY